MRKDRLTKDQRSRNMSRVRSRDTQFEKTVFGELKKRGVYFKQHYKKAYGNPDIARPKSKKAVFLHSDFWHGWQLSRWENILPSDFWKTKLHKNRLRDKKVITTLRKKGWNVMIVWEHSLKQNRELYIEKIVEFLR